MADTKRTVTALKALLADNTSGNISPQDIRDVLVTCLGVSGGIGIPTISTADQALVAATPAKVTMFTVEQSHGVTGDHANDEMTVPIAGLYLVLGNFSMKSSTGNVTFDFVVNVDGSPTGIATQRKVSTGGDVGSASFGGFLQLTANQVLTLEAEASNNTNLNFTRAQFIAILIGE